MLEHLAALAAPCAQILRERGQWVAVADGATGGLISAGLIAIPGATKFFKGSGTIYSLKGRDLLLGLPREAYDGMRGVTEPYALLQARAIAARFGADWGIAESGSAGPPHPHGADVGKSCIAVIGPGVTLTRIVETGLASRTGNMEAFAKAALELFREALG